MRQRASERERERERERVGKITTVVKAGREFKKGSRANYSAMCAPEELLATGYVSACIRVCEENERRHATNGIPPPTITTTTHTTKTLDWPSR